nr:hypothetical protein [Tanacetum cinerariifolium]
MVRDTVQLETAITTYLVVHRGFSFGTALSRGKDRGFPRRQDMDLFSLIRAPNPTKVKAGARPHAAQEVPLLTVTASAPVDVSDLDPLSFVDPQSRPSADVAQSSNEAAEAGDPKLENTSFTSWSGHLKAFIGQNGAETDMKKAAKGRSAELSKELENIRALFSDLQVEQRCAEMDARLDALSIDFDEELYSHMLTTIACHRWVIRHGLRLAVMKCGESTELRQAFADVVLAGIAKGMSEGLKHRVEHGKANLSLKAIEAYDSQAEAKYIATLHALKDLKYPIVDQLESLKDALMDVIMASLHLESDTGDDASRWIRELRPSSSQLTIPVYSEARDPTDHWACKEEILLADAIAANVSRAEKKKKWRVVCRTHRVGSAYHVRSNGVSVSVPTVAPQGLAILLADAATQTEISEDKASPRLLRSSSLPVMQN